MIYYFSGTGNSRYIAQKIADKTGDRLVCINDKIKANEKESTDISGNLIFVTPTYAWRIPRIVREWILNTSFSKVENVWFVMTCGAEIGHADKYNRQLCAQKGFNYKGTAQVIMPENYIALFDAPQNEEAVKIVQKSQTTIETIAQRIDENKEFDSPRNNLYDRFMSGPVNVAFYSLFVKSKAFYAKDTCIGCGKCVQVCPLNNIQLVGQKPTWQNHCTHCMACINTCPTEAIEYGKKSVGKVRYTLDKLKLK